jgi:hypothetical protein
LVSDLDSKLGESNHGVARNVIFLSFLVDGSAKNLSLDTLWNIYYNSYLSGSDLDILQTQAKKLISASKSLDVWRSSRYGSSLRFCDEATLSNVHSILGQYASATSSKESVKSFEKAMQQATDFKVAVYGERPITYTGVRAASPLGVQLMGDMEELIQSTWEKSMRAVGDTRNPNPLLSSALSDNVVLAYPSNPILSFHVATAQAKLTDLSPLRMDSSTDGKGASSQLVEAAKLQFREWVSAFRARVAAGGIMIRFIIADCFSLCHTLQHNLATGETSANWYRRLMDMKPLVLNEVEYGRTSKGKARRLVPRQFDVIDTSNIADYSGAANILAAAGPLLKDLPSSTLYTEAMARGGASSISPVAGGERTKFDDLVAGHTLTLSVLLGLTPIDYWTNTTTTSKVDEYLMAMSVDGEQEPRVQSQLAWKRSSHVSGHAAYQKPSIPADKLAAAFMSIYGFMFMHENLSMFMNRSRKDVTQFMLATAHPKYHRGSLAALIKAVCQAVDTDTSAFAEQLVDLISDDETSQLGSNHVQALSLALLHAGVYSVPSLTADIQRDESLSKHKGGEFCRWKDIPAAVAVTVVIPPEKWQRVYNKSKNTNILPLEGYIRAENGNVGSWHNIFGDVQVAFGSVTTTGSPGDDDYLVQVEADSAGWMGNSTMVASFYVWAAALQLDIPKTLVGLCLQSTAQCIQMFSWLGSPMAVFETSLGDSSKVHITKYLPHQSGYAVVAGRDLVTLDLSSLSITKKTHPITMTPDLDPKFGNIQTITGRVNITTTKGQKLLADKTPINLRQVDPFTIEVVFSSQGKEIRDLLVCPMTFPLPVVRETSKMRVARKSQYVEVIANIATPASSGCLDTYIFPTVLHDKRATALNMPNVWLDGMAILDVYESVRPGLRFLTTLTSFTFSSRERQLREQPKSRSGLSTTSTRLNLKESIFTMFMLSSGLQGGQSGLFAVSHPERGGVHIVFLVSAIRLDGPGGSVVLDAAVLPLTMDLVRGTEIREFLLILQDLQLCTINVDDAELDLWKSIIPAWAERCRTWSHTSSCEYARNNATLPLSLGQGEQFMCSCGQGIFPKDFMPLPDWEIAAKYATRVAISPTYAVPFVEDVVYSKVAEKAWGTVPSSGSVLQNVESCRNCGRTEGKGVASLKKCMRCLTVKYCSAECQKKDWKKHRMECQESIEHAET